jgi:hypothetical protein
MAKRIFLAAACAGGLAACVPGTGAGAAGQAPRVEIVAFGVYARSAELGPLPAGYRQHSILDVSLMRMPRLLRATDRIEARPCLRFGLQYRAPDLAPDRKAVAEVRVTHPPLTRPDGRRSEADTYEVPLGRGAAWTGFDFDEPWEIAPGSWTFTLLYAGQVVARKRFTVAAAPSEPAAPKTCLPPVA